MIATHKNFIDLTNLPKVRRAVSQSVRDLFLTPYQDIRIEIEKLPEKERSALDLLQLFKVWGVNSNCEIAQVIRFNLDYYIPILSSLAPKLYHPKKNGWAIFALLAGIVSISKFEPIKLTDQMYDIVNKALVDKRISVKRQALSVIFAGMYPTFGEESIKPIFKKKILRKNIATAINSVIQEVFEGRSPGIDDVRLSVKFQLGLTEAGISITSRIPYSGKEIIQTFKRWFGLREGSIKSN